MNAVAGGLKPCVATRVYCATRDSLSQCARINSSSGMYLKTSAIVTLNSDNPRVNLGSGESCGKALALSLIKIKY